MGPGKGPGLTDGRERRERRTKRTPRRRGTQKKDKKAKHESKVQTVPVGGGREEWVKRV